MTKNIYTSLKLKYPLSEEEYNQIDNVWSLINIFSKPFLYISDYREYLVKSIKKKYTAEEFGSLEIIIEKIFWNLRWYVFPLFIDGKMNKNEYNKFIENNYNNTTEIPYSLTLCNKIHFYDEVDLDKKIKNISLNDDIYYRSFINKIIIVDNVNKVIYNKKMEGSAEIFSKNIFNLYTLTILLNRNIYESIMHNPYSIINFKLEFSRYYYQYDYGFPNLNCCSYGIGDNKYRLNRIIKLYFNMEKKDYRYWYKLLI
jgi:hypothetical protein